VESRYVDGRELQWVNYPCRTFCALISASLDSDVVHLNLLGADHIILNSNEAITDLLDKRSTLYSDRVRAF